MLYISNMLYIMARLTQLLSRLVSLGMRVGKLQSSTIKPVAKSSMTRAVLPYLDL